MFHQPLNTFGTKIYNAVLYTDATFKEHFHKSYELIYCVGERAQIEVESETIELSCGDFLLLFPYKKHAFHIQSEKNAIWVGVFSGDYVKEFDREFADREPKNAKFRVDERTEEYLKNTFLLSAPLDKYAIKGLLYLVLGEFAKQAKFRPRSVGEKRELIMQIIEYVEKNFREEITLQTLAKELGYNFQYLSRVFRQSMRMNFRALVNQYRFDHARLLLEKENITVMQAALDSGFQSVRNFNRLYKEKTGQTPQRVKRDKKKSK